MPASKPPTLQGIETSRHADGWYYLLDSDGQKSPLVGPFATQQLAMIAGRKALAELQVARRPGPLA